MVSTFLVAQKALVIASAAWLAPLEVPSSTVSIPVAVELIDGASRTGLWEGLDGERAIRVREGAESTVLPLDELSFIEFDARKVVADRRPKPTEPSPSKRGAPSDASTTTKAILYLNDGGRIAGRVTAADENGLTVEFSFASGVAVSLDHLAAIQWSEDPELDRADGLFRASLKERLTSEDVLITGDRKDPKLLRGRLERINLDGAVFQFAGKSRTVQLDRLYGMVLATGTRRPAREPATFQLADGSSFSGELLAGGAGSLKIRGSFGGEISVPVGALRTIRVHSERVAYLSDLSFIKEQTVGRLHRAWPVQRDRTVSGKPIVLDGRRFDKGIGCHSFTELRFKLDGAFERFVATIGLDESVRPRGAVLFRVEGDGRTLFESGLVTGQDAPRDVRVDVSGVRELGLVVDYGDGLDLADQAVGLAPGYCAREETVPACNESNLMFVTTASEI